MTQSALIIGNGISGLLLALTLSKKQWKVTIISELSKDPDDSPLISPEFVMSFLEEQIPGAEKELRVLGARHSTHQEMLSSKFPGAVAKRSGDFLFLGRKLFLSYLREKARALGIEFLEKQPTQLLVEEGVVKGVATGELNVNADFVFDCTGSYRARSLWLKNHARTGEIIRKSGSEEVMFLRFFESEKRPQLKLRSGEKFRGGIYPVENNRFVISMIVPFDRIPRDMEKALKEFLSFIGAVDEFSGSSPSGPWIRRDHITNYISDFYLSGLTDEIKNFYAVGDSLIFSNPIYGRGMALTVYQLRAILKNENLREGLKAGFLNAYDKWKEVAKEKKSFPFRLLRKYYLFLLEREPVVYEAFLDFYQLRTTPVKLLCAVLLSPLSLKILSLFVLILSGLIWVLISYLQ